MTRYEQEWHYRRVVMEAILDILQDGRPRTTRQILHKLPYNDDVKVNKRLVNSILSSEAKRYVFRDHKAYTYRIREADIFPVSQPPWDLVRRLILQKLKFHGPLTVNELKDALENDVIPTPIWMIRAILADDSFRHSA